MISVFVHLRQNGSQTSRLFVIAKAGVSDESVRSISSWVIDNGLGAQVGLQFSERCQGIRRQGASFPRTLFLGESCEGSCQLSEVSDVASKEVT
jgi:hypothetical protein